MLSAAITYQVLQQENPATIEKVKTILEKHPWYTNQWQARLQDVPAADRDMVLFMQAARWADDIRSNDKQNHRAQWHYINWPFKPEGQPASVQIKDPEPVNILPAMAENENVVKKESDPERRAIALAWLFHLVGDIHQPLHTAQLLTVEYPQGDRGGNEICVQFVVKYKDEYPCIPLQHPRCLSGHDSRNFHWVPGVKSCCLLRRIFLDKSEA
jgi:hypothetical protein